jgi:glycolate oxidase
VADVEGARQALEDALGAGEVLSDPLALRLYARDASMVEGGCALVAFPRSRDDIVACVGVAAEHGLPVVPRGSGTGLAGGSTPIGDALVVVTTKMTDILEIRPADRLAWVEPGVPNLDLANALRPRGFTFAPDPSSQQTSSIGGNVSTNAGGPHCLAYGVTSNHVLALDVVLADGGVVRLGSEAPEAAGYDLRAVMVGSEGTLGVVAAVCVRLTPLPPAVRTMLFDFATVEDCAATVSGIIASGVTPAAVEMMDRGIVVAAEGFAHAGYPTDAAGILIVEVDGTAAAVEAQSTAVEAAARANRTRSVRVALDEVERALIWKGRKSAFAAVGRISPDYIVQDGVIPRTSLPVVLARIDELSRESGIRVANVFHAGDGNLHPLVLYDDGEPGAGERAEEVSGKILDLCIEHGGSITGEHGVGVDKSRYMARMFTDIDLDTMQMVRCAFDPAGLCNPGKVFPTPRLCGEVPGRRSGVHPLVEAGKADQF